MSLERSGFSEEIQENESVFKQRLVAFASGFLLLVEKQTEAVVGYLCTELWKTEEAPSREHFLLGHDLKEYHYLDGERLYIASMTVAPNYRSLGLGRFFFSESIDLMLKRFSQISEVFLVVNPSWTKAFRIYQENGFVEVDRLEHFFNAPKGQQTGIVMWKRLASH